MKERRSSKLASPKTWQVSKWTKRLKDEESCREVLREGACLSVSVSLILPNDHYRTASLLDPT